MAKRFANQNTSWWGLFCQHRTFLPEVKLKVTSSEGTETSAGTSRAEYYYPHEIPNLKTESLGDIQGALDRSLADPSTQFTKIGPQFKRLDCIYEIWDKELLLKEDSPFASALTEEQKLLIERHDVIVYGAFLRSAKIWGEFNEDVLKLRKGQRIIQGETTD